MSQSQDDELGAAMFARVLSHDLGTLIRTARHLSGYVREDILREDLDSAMHAVGMLDIRLANLDRFVADLIRYYRAGQRQAEMEQFSLTAVIRDVYQKLSFPVTAELRLSCGHDIVMTDRAMIRTVIGELLENALVHHPDPKQLMLDIDISQSQDSRTIIIVRDNGDGLKGLDASQVFVPFSKETTRANAAGLGLAICKRELAAVSGEICVQPTAEGFAIALILPTVADLPSFTDKPRIRPLKESRATVPGLRIV